ncbi:MAG: ribonuclease HI [Bacteriovoracales bacterium]|nr:ribonuclease HI [Bacteriovoracales bacterium]
MRPSKKIKERFVLYLKEMRTELAGDPGSLGLIRALEQRLEGREGGNSFKIGADGSEGAKGLDFPLPPEIVDEKSFALFSDGACRGNPGPGAWASFGQDFRGSVFFEASGVEINTTNNRMEMEAAAQAFEALGSYCQGDAERPSPEEVRVFLYSDSKYLVDGMNRWIKGWKLKGWRKKDGGAPENLDLWKNLDRLVERFKAVGFHWVKGHGGHPQNEYCDRLANKALDESGYFI